eukprot:12351683-Alexandrium_andersonii.AAC.1
MDRSTGNLASHLIPRKGDHWFGIKMLRAEIAYLGHRKVILKSDQEPSIMAFEGGSAEGMRHQCGSDHGGIACRGE